MDTSYVTMARLDRWYCFKHHFNIIKQCAISPVGFSDHGLVSCNVFITNVKPRSAYWHFNTVLLQDKWCLAIFGNSLRIRSHPLILCNNGGTLQK